MVYLHICIECKVVVSALRLVRLDGIVDDKSSVASPCILPQAGKTDCILQLDGHGSIVEESKSNKKLLFSGFLLKVIIPYI